MKKIIYILTVIFAIACTQTKNEEVAFDEKELIQDIGTHSIVPEIEKFYLNTTELYTKIQTFNTQRTEENLNAAQAQWKTTANSYASVYLFNIGDLKKAYTHVKLFNWPTSAGTIENNTLKETIDETIVMNLGSGSKGLNGIEYLLFNANNETVLSQFTTIENRGLYLELIAKELQSNAQNVYDKWRPEGENYVQTLVNSEATSIKGSFNMIYNGMFNLLDNAKVTKIGKPAGLEKTKTTNTKLLQAPYSKYSKEMILANLNAIENLFFNTNGLNIADFVYSKTKETTLSDEFKSKLNTCRAKVNAIDGTFYSAINEEKDAMENLHDAIEALRLFTAVALKWELSVVITSTDNDGD